MTHDNPTPEPAQDPKGEPTPEPKADETDWKAEARKWEQRAKENKGAADELTKIREANKTELQKAQERAEAAEQRAVANERRATQTQIASEFGVPLEAIHGDDEAAMRESAERLVAWRDSNKPKPPEPKKLRSGAAGSGDTSGSRAAAALRQMRGAGN